MNIEGMRRRAMTSLSNQTKPLTPDTGSMLKTLALIIGGLLALGWVFVKLRGYFKTKRLPGSERLIDRLHELDKKDEE